MVSLATGSPRFTLRMSPRKLVVSRTVSNHGVSRGALHNRRFSMLWMHSLYSVTQCDILFD